MRKVKQIMSTLLPYLYVFGMSVGLIGAAVLPTNPKAGKDTALYFNDDSGTTYSNPDFRVNDDDDDEGEVTVVVNKLILHYYNEDGNNDGRAFYLWVTGVDGFEYNTKFSEHNPNGALVHESGTLMTITLDFTLPEFTDYAGRSGMYFIIKYEMESESSLNWGGQSDDMFIKYANYENVISDGVCELWTMPAAGGGIAILDSEAKTKVHGVALAQFVDWRTIHCTLTSDTVSVNWKLYAFDQTYFRNYKPREREDVKKNYLVKESTGVGDFDIKLKYEAHINVVYSLVSHDPSTDSDPDMAVLSKEVTVAFDKLYDSDKFHTYYENGTLNRKLGDKALGMTYSPSGTTFRVWSPISANMSVLIYEKDTSSEYCGSEDAAVRKAYDKYKRYPMTYKSGGYWEITLSADKVGDLDGKYYNYQVDNVLGTNIVMDPYATSAGANGLRALIYDKNSSKVTPTGWNELKNKWTTSEYDISTPQELTIYEVHIQDFTGDDSWNGTKPKGTYEAFVEPNTKLRTPTGEDDVDATGYDHLKYLGVKAVQIMPTFDHDNNEVAENPKYNWGYNPLNYNVPEGAYSSNPHDGYARVKEFREMVLKLSETPVHTRTIMDVVYNHVSSATGSNFHKLMPRYYFRYSMQDYTYSWEEYDETLHHNVTKYSTVKAGELWDGSGCHNEVASERPMMRKFIVDSLCMWAEDYQIKGFRFDLMGLIDFRTMLEAKKALWEIDPDIYMYGEGWTSRGYHGEGSYEWNTYYGQPAQSNYGAFTWQVYNECNSYRGSSTLKDEIYLGGFNDNFRNAVKGSNDGGGGGYPGIGWIQRGNYSGSDFKEDYLSCVAAGLWGFNLGVNGNGEQGNSDNTGRYPEQTVNYVSCHDNWTLRDHLYQTMLSNRDFAGSDIGPIVMRASIQAHALTFASNGVAFILGGEELFRTKTVAGKDNEGNTIDYKDQVADKDSYREMYGNTISHNSYNSPLAVNSFKWDNKKSVTFYGNKNGSNFSSTITNAKFNYVDAFQKIIEMHSHDTIDSTSTPRNFKRGEANKAKIEDYGFPWGNYWWSKDNQNKSNASNCVVINLYNDRHVMVFVGPGLEDAGNVVNTGSDINDDSRKIFRYGNWNKDSYTYRPVYDTTDPYNNNAWNAILIGRP